MGRTFIRGRLVRDFAYSRTLDRQADSLRVRIPDLAADLAALADVLQAIEVMRGTLAGAEVTARRLRTDLDRDH